MSLLQHANQFWGSDFTKTKVNSLNSVNMSLSHAAGQVNVTKYFAARKKTLLLLLTTTIVFSIITKCHLTVNFSFIS